MLLGAAIAAQLASGRTVDDINVLAALFTIIGDNLALLAASQASSSQTSSDRANLNGNTFSSRCRRDENHDLLP